MAQNFRIFVKEMLTQHPSEPMNLALFLLPALLFVIVVAESCHYQTQQIQNKFSSQNTFSSQTFSTTQIAIQEVNPVSLHNSKNVLVCEDVVFYLAYILIPFSILRLFLFVKCINAVPNPKSSKQELLQSIKQKYRQGLRLLHFKKEG